MAKNVRRVKKRSEAEPVSVREAVGEYLASSQVKRLRLVTQQGYEHELDVFSVFCTEKEYALHEIDSKVIDLFLNYLKQTRKSSKAGVQELSTYTLEGYVRVIKSFLNWCLLDEQYSLHIKALTVERIKKPQIIEVVIEPFTPDQIVAMFKACDLEESEHLRMRDRAILAMLLDTGIRANELCTLTLGNISLEAKDSYVKVLGKGQKWGEVGLGNQARLYLKKYIRQFREPTIEHEVKSQAHNLSEKQLKQVQNQTKQYANVFVNRGGSPLTKSGLYQIIRRLGERAGITGVRCSPHTFRHTFAAMFMRNGGEIYQLSKLLRHAEVATTEEYLKSLKQSEARRGAKSVLDNL